MANIVKNFLKQPGGCGSSGTRKFKDKKRSSDTTPARRMDVMVVEPDHHQETQETMAKVMANRITEPEIILVGDYKSENQMNNFSSILGSVSAKSWGADQRW